MGTLKLCFAVFVAGCVFTLIDQCILSDVESCSGKTAAVETEIGTGQCLFGLVGKCLGVQTLSPVLGDEPAIARDVAGTRL